MNQMTHRPSIEAPQLRTLLLTDLCDSTQLVERIGDVEAATLFRDHDRLVLDLQQRWRGRLIDRSDGLLLLFERPIDGLGFALDYVRGLRELGGARKLDLKARAGLHVGEVLTWRNSDEAVKVGAKPLEVEGLAKPMAARLMAMARPGQILLSAVAEPLAHRAARELGERGQHLLWKSHGRWRFKGLPDSQQIYEVGEPGIAPLRAPPNTPKAWRDIPLWRRPAALAAEAAIIAGIGVGVWFTMRPAPAIAFSQRDWVVVADLRNLTGQSVLDDSLEQAFRISLEQSRYVNVLSDLKARDTLARMQLKPDTVLDRAVASEIALRDGARAVILPTVSEVGGKVRVSAEVIDPHTQATVHAETADGNGVGSTLESIDLVTAALRSNLGEAVESVRKDSDPLPEVTTKNLDALRAYALAQRAFSQREFAEALQLYERATSLDPHFALGWLGQMRVHYARMDTQKAVAPLRKAQKLRAGLPPREQMYLDAWRARFDMPAKATAGWQELARMYPDYCPGPNNAAMWLFAENRFPESLAFARKAQDPHCDMLVVAHDSVGRAELALNEFDDAILAFNKASAIGFGSSRRRLLSAYAAQGKFHEASGIAEELAQEDRHSYIERSSLSMAQGNWTRAQSQARTGLALAQGSGYDERSFLVTVAVAEWLAGDKVAAIRHARDASLKALAALDQPFDPDAEDDANLALAGALVAVRLGDREFAENVRAKVAAHKALSDLPSVNEMAAVVQAQGMIVSGHPEQAVELLRPKANGRERFQTRVALMEAYSALNNADDALEQAQWLQRNRGRAYIEMTCSYCIQGLNVADSEAAARHEQELLRRAARTSGEPQPARQSG